MAEQDFEAVENELRKTKISGARLIVKVLKSHGVTFICSLCGDSTAELILEANKAGIRVVDVRQEATGVFAGKASSRITGIPGVMVVTSGPGLANTIHGALDANFDHFPLIIMSGGVATKMRGIGYIRDFDQLGLMKSVCKAVFSLEKKEKVVDVMKEAFQVAMSHIPGPVYIQMPTDILDANYEFKPVPHLLQFLDESSSKEVIDLRAPKLDFSPLPIHFAQASTNDITTSVDLIKKGEKPIIVVGSQAVLEPSRILKLTKYLKGMKIPTFLKFASKGLMGKAHKYLLTQDALIKNILQEADTVILAGIVPDFITLRFGFDLPRHGNIISVNRNAKLGSLNDGKFWNSAQIVEGDPGRYLCALSKCLQEDNYCGPESWTTYVRQIENKYEAELRNKADEKANVHLNPLKILRTLEEVLGGKNILWVFDEGDFTKEAAYFLKPTSPLSWIGSEPFSGVGASIGYAIGSKLACPDREVWCIAGDGAQGYTITEYGTLERHNIHVATVVGNDGRWGEVCRKQIVDYGTSFACTLEFTKYEKMVRPLGGKGYYIDEKNSTKLVHFLKAMSAGLTTTSRLINVLMGLTDLREGHA